jgi:hypothetical protein
VIWGLRLVHLRFRGLQLAAGLAVLAQPRPRARLIAIVLAFTGAALMRTWLALIGFGLPSEPADAALLLFSMGAIGLLPLGSVGNAPAATVAAMGATDISAATAAGMVIGASTVLAALIYAAACWACDAHLTRSADRHEAPANVIALPLRPAAESEPELDLAA